MQYQLIQNFLELPGIIGFSLMPLDPTEASGQAYSVGFPQGNGRSEEHTSELQSLTNLVCRLLLEKKKQTKKKKKTIKTLMLYV